MTDYWSQFQEVKPKKGDYWSQFQEVKQEEKPKSTTVEDILGGITAFDRGYDFGLAKKLGGLVNAIGASPVDAIMSDKSLKDAFKDRYNEIVQTAEDAQANFAERNPVTNASLEIGAAIANPVNKVALGFIPKAGGFAKRVVGSGVVGGGVSALDSTINENDNAVKDALTTSAVGSALPIVGSSVRAGGRVLSQILGKTTGAGDVAIMDAFKAGQTGNKAFLKNMNGNIDAEGLGKKVQANFDKIKQARNKTYEADITRLKQETMDKKLDINPVINDVKAIIKEEGGGAEYLVDDDTARVLSKTKDTLNKFYKDKERHNLDGFDNLKKALQNIKTQEGSNAERVKTNIANSIKGQILKQSPEYKKINDAYSKDSELLTDLKKVFSLNRNANSETILKKMQSTARNNANTDWGYRAQLLKKLDPTGEIQQEISANALSQIAPRGGIAGLFGGAGLLSALYNPSKAPLLLASSPSAVGYGAYGLGKLRNFAPQSAGKTSPYVAQMLRLLNNEGN